MALIIESGTARAMRERLLRPRALDARGLVLHTTGAGPWSRWKANPDRFDGPYEAAKYVYERISKYSGHYLVCGDSGSITRLVSPEYIAWHVGSKGAWRYKMPGWAKGKKLGWWFSRFPECRSPRDILDGALWRGSANSCNRLTIGVEVSPPRAGPREAWSPKTWRALRLLTKHLGDRYGIPLDRYHVFTHSDAHPFARTTKTGAPWDPAPRQWKIGQAVEELKLLG